MSVDRELAALLGAEAVISGTERAATPYLTDATESRAIRGRAEAVALPDTAAEVATVLGWCYEHDVPLTPRGGGTGYAGGAVPIDGGVVLSLERLSEPPRIDAGQWRARVAAGAFTADLRRRVRETGLFFPPDPGAAERSMIGGNLATNAGGPHSFKYGVTGAWVTGVEVAIAPGELISVGGPIRKDAAGYDLKSLLIGSEGTLGIITSAWLKLIPAPASELPVAGLYPDIASGCEAVAGILSAGLVPATLEFLDAGALSATAEALTRALPDLSHAVARRAGFLVLAEADGSAEQADRLRSELQEAMGHGALQISAPQDRREIRQLWQWRAGVSPAVIAQRGGKLSEDIVVPVERLQDALLAVDEIGARHQLPTCSWGHAGDGNLHATLMIDSEHPIEVERAEAASQELFGLAIELGGSVSGEHGLGLVKRGALARQWDPAAVALHEQIKRLFDPKGLINPGKKLAR